MSSLVTVVVLLSSAFAARPPGIAQRRNIPDVFLEVGARQRDNGKLSDGVHLFQLFCSGGQCALTTLTLNQCFSGNGSNSFHPKIERVSTKEGNLSLSDDGRVIATRWSGGDPGGSYVITLRFEYERRKGDPLITRLRDFSGVLVRSSTILNKAYSVDYVPLRGAFVEVPIDCPAAIPGLPEQP